MYILEILVFNLQFTIQNESFSNIDGPNNMERNLKLKNDLENAVRENRYKTKVAINECFICMGHNTVTKKKQIK